MQDQRNASAAGFDSTGGDSPPPEQLPTKNKTEENTEPLNLNIRQDFIDGEFPPGLTSPTIRPPFHIEDGTKTSPNTEHQFIPNFTRKTPVHQEDNHESRKLSALRNTPGEEIYVSLRLGAPDQKRRKSSDASISIADAK